MIFVSTGNLITNATNTSKKIKILNNSKIYNIELSSGKYEQNLEKKLMNNKKSTFLVHNYFPVPKKGFVFNLSSKNVIIQKQSLNLAKKSIRLTRKLGAKYYSFHGGFLVDPKINQLGKVFNYSKICPRKRAIKIFVKNVQILLKYADKFKVSLLIENNVLTKKNYYIFKCNPFLFVQSHEIIEIIKKLDYKVKLLVDLGHLKVSAKTLKFDKNKFLKKCEKFIKAYHISDNNSIEDQNNLISQRSWFWKNIKKDAEFYSLEIKTKFIKEIKNQLKIMKDKL
jgi:sugar phosphate isomerase/epimerase